MQCPSKKKYVSISGEEGKPESSSFVVLIAWFALHESFAARRYEPSDAGDEAPVSHYSTMSIAKTFVRKWRFVLEHPLRLHEYETKEMNAESNGLTW